MNTFHELREMVWRHNLEIPRHGLAIYTFGNVSAIDRDEGVVAIKPSGVPYEVLKSEDIVAIDLDGRVVAGSLAPSSDTKTHLLLYRAFPKIGGIVHTHSTHATAWAQAARPIPVLGTTHADHLHVDIPCTEVMPDEKIQNDYEIETGNQILKVFEKISYEDVEMVLVAGHAPFTWGSTPAKAVYNSVVLEELARIALYTIQINPQCTRLKEALIQKHYQRKHGPDAYYGQDRLSKKKWSGAE